MNKIVVKCRKVLGDTYTPVNLFLNLREHYPQIALLESSDSNGRENSLSFICVDPIASYKVTGNTVSIQSFDTTDEVSLNGVNTVPDSLKAFIDSFEIEGDKPPVPNGVFGYSAYDSVQYFEDIDFREKQKDGSAIPEMFYALYRIVIVMDHINNDLFIVENCPSGEASKMSEIEALLTKTAAPGPAFSVVGVESCNITDDDFIRFVRKGKEHCKRGDVFQIVLSRRFSRQYTGDDFNVYRTLRNINPSPYLFYFDFEDFRIFGSSPESQVQIKQNEVALSPIAGTFKRTGNDNEDRKLASELLNDPKENAEHIMLVDLARNDISRNATDVKLAVFKEVQFYSHVIHLVSKVTGKIKNGVNKMKVFGDSFPAGTLTGAPKFKAMELIDEIENDHRGFYGGSIGYISFDGDVNQAIMIRTVLSKNNRLYYQAGAGVIVESKEENELQEVHNKLGAIRNAIRNAEFLNVLKYETSFSH